MKKLIALSIFILPLLVNGQSSDIMISFSPKAENYYMHHLFIGRQPSARAESLGKAYCALDGDMASVFNNPAGIATISKLEFNNSYSTPYYSFNNDTYYNFTSIGYHFNQYLTVGLSRNYLFGGSINLTNEDGSPKTKEKDRTINNTLTISSEPIKNLLIGINTNYINKDIGQKTSALYFDFGVIKKFDIGQNEVFKHHLSVASSIVNLNFADLKFIVGMQDPDPLPAVNRTGFSYNFGINKQLITDRLKTINFLATAEYQWLLNTKYGKGIHTGAELMFFEIVSVRTGYYKESIYDFGISSNNSQISSLTYGFGLQLPIYKLTDLPININFDYTTLPQVSSSYDPNPENFKTFTVRVNWMMKE
jgi:hypothetical protein